MPGLVTLILATDPAGTPYLAGIVAGFVIGALGHLFASRALVLIGIVVIMLTTLLFIIATDPTS